LAKQNFAIRAMPGLAGIGAKVVNDGKGRLLLTAFNQQVPRRARVSQIIQIRRTDAPFTFTATCMSESKL
jgi:hypothetical protein